jgi:hypothetical protein
MATTTPNYGWTVPTSTDLVKDGATAIETLGDAIDASLVDLRGGTTGQVLRKQSNTQMDFEWATVSSGLTLINTTSFSAVSSQSVNSVFSATYDYYLIVVSGTDGDSPALRMRVSGTDDTGSNYSRYGAINTININDLNNTSFRFMASSAGSDPWLSKIELSNPFAAAKTSFLSQGTRHPDAYNNIISGRHQLTTSYTGFTLISTTNMTGFVSTYGYSK